MKLGKKGKSLILLCLGVLLIFIPGVLLALFSVGMTIPFFPTTVFTGETVRTGGSISCYTVAEPSWIRPWIVSVVLMIIGVFLVLRFLRSSGSFRRLPESDLETKEQPPTDAPMPGN